MADGEGDGSRGTEANRSEAEPQDTAISCVPKDTGWAWCCVLGGFFMNFLVVGAAAKSFGILFVEIVDKFDASNAATSWIVALSQCLALILGPVATTLAGYFSSRTVVFVGGLFCCAGFIISMYAVSLRFLYFSYGILVGIGSALAYAPTIVTVGHYFEKRRALANGITVAGSGVGNFAIPPLMRLLLDHYALQGALLVLAGIMLNVCVCAVLLRPIEFYQNIHLAKRKSRLKAAAAADEEKDVEKVVTGAGDAANASSISNGVLLQRDRSSQPLVEQTPVSGSSSQLEGLDLKADVVYGSLQSLPRAEKKGCAGSPACCVRACSPSSRSVKSAKFDWTLLKNPVFLLYAFSVFFAFCGYPQLFFIIPPHAQQLNIDKTDAAFLVSIIGITDLIGRIGFGWFADFNIVKKRTIFWSSMAVAGIACFFIPLLDSFIGLAVFCALIGLFAGAFIALTAVILAEGLGVQHLQSAFGLVVMFMGVSFLFAPATAGWLKDVTGSWDASFYFCGATMFTGSIFPLFEPLAIKYLKRQRGEM